MSVRCPTIGCYRSRVDAFCCKRHGGIVNKCIAVVRSTGNSCNFNSNDSGNLCGIHGGPSKILAEDLDYFSHMTSIHNPNDFFDLIVQRHYTSPAVRRLILTVNINRAVYKSRSYMRFQYMYRDAMFRAILSASAMETASESVSVDLLRAFDKLSVSECVLCSVECETEGVKTPCCKQESCANCMSKWICMKGSCPFCRKVVC